ncbi:MAG: hypothetical protein Kow0068_22850 [Marinilabiliales bacterium]
MDKLKHIIISFLILFCCVYYGYSQTIKAAFYADTTIVCVNTPLQFYDNSTAGQITSWTWNFGNGDISTLQNPVATYTSTGTYTVSLTITDTSGVSKTKTKINYIIVRDLPTADFTYARLNDVFTTDTFNLSSFWYTFSDNSVFPDSMQCSYFWDFGDGVFHDSTDTVIYMFTGQGNYTVQYIVETGLNCQDTASVTIKVEDVFNAPNVFTPDGDGINDLFVIETNGYNTYKMIIFNRWGNIVKVIEAKKLIWDGYSSAGVKLDPGVYFYHVISSEIPNFKKSGLIYLY